MPVFVSHLIGCLKTRFKNFSHLRWHNSDLSTAASRHLNAVIESHVSIIVTTPFQIFKKRGHLQAF
jgi:hypothetical protein